MAVKPIDFQVMIPKTTEISKVQNEYNQKDYTNQYHASLSLQQQADHETKKVNSSDKAFGGKIRQKQKEEGNNQLKQKRNRTGKENKGNKEEDCDKSQPSKGHVIDILI
ncbi:MAG: hypothetical protein PWR27_19 [Petroclostridium sp.]|uniref:hypothetical protein n=1 Tax=Petroclostridium xylanilyticum TaxID=1792311 RepID=UPI000B991884|nr:hypothetical protein [Petroclostridium xylanilyticum]MBZ4645890.1 hypothetical protein [Clostridia bacterium]MDK2809310.1 hypothetical protein [Petroclostridium sp.]